MPRPHSVEAHKKLHATYNFQPYDPAKDDFIPRKKSVKTPYMC